MWRNVIAELGQEGHIGDAFPVACHRHPDSIKYISEPGKLPQFAPDGGFCDTYIGLIGLLFPRRGLFEVLRCSA